MVTRFTPCVRWALDFEFNSHDEKCLWIIDETPASAH